MSKRNPIVIPPSRRHLTGLCLLVVLHFSVSGPLFAQQGEAVWQSAQGTVAASPANTRKSTQLNDYRLGSGDRVKITVFGQPELTGEFQVDGGGIMSYPLIGQFPAGGLTANELEKTIVSKLEPDYLKKANVNVEVLAYRPFYIVGEVKQPGSYSYVSGMSVINAVALAGGFTYRAREDSFYVTRSDGSGGKVRLKASEDTAIDPGDVITVRERYF